MTHLLNRGVTTMVGAVTSILVLFAVAIHTSPGFASDDDGNVPEDKATAEQLVQEALYQEIYGRNDLRTELLNQAAEQQPKADSIQWHRGKVKMDGQWLNADEVSKNAINKESYKLYLKFRDSQNDDEAGNLIIANWCNQNGLTTQEQAHLDRVIFFAADHAEARQRLGFVRLNDRWVNRQDLISDATEWQTAARRLSAWREPVETLRAELTAASTQKQYDEAIAELNKIDTPAAIPALESILGGVNETIATTVVHRIANMEQIEATDALIRFSVLNPWQNVRLAAAQALGKRDRFEYVPTMLGELSTPVINQTQTIPMSRDRVIHRQVFVRELQNEHQVVELNTAYHLLRVNNVGDSGIRTRRMIRADERQNERLQEQQNLNTQQLNDRITAALSEATGEENGTDPRQWWKWWNDENEVYLASYKAVNSDVNNRVVNVVDRNTYDGSTPSGPSLAIAPSRSCECLVAGTPILTERGFVAVEEMKVGDMVMSQNVETGELEYQAVLRPTVRPKTMVYNINVGNEEISASGGHPFWVSGEGWVLARDLKPGMPLHTPDGSITIKSVSDGPIVELFNLIVANNQNYFVGKSRILSHDNSLREPTKRVVPGLRD